MVFSPTTREHTTIPDWLCRIRAEYREVPGLNLTRQQAKRLWGLDDVTCDSLLAALVDTRFLRLTASGTYVLTD
jgi:hypothetical protein